MTLVCLAADKKTTHSGNEEASDDEVDYDDDDEHAPSFYDKSKSFFDNISCNASEKAQGYVAHSVTFMMGLKNWTFVTYSNKSKKSVPVSVIFTIM